MSPKLDPAAHFSSAERATSYLFALPEAETNALTIRRDPHGDDRMIAASTTCARLHPVFLGRCNRVPPSS
jgi:hypothetical protein